jgi:hypothetical protein
MSRQRGDDPAASASDGTARRSARRRAAVRVFCWGMFLLCAARIGAYVLFQEHTPEGFQRHAVVLVLLAGWGWLLVRSSAPTGGAGSPPR